MFSSIDELIASFEKEMNERHDQYQVYADNAERLQYPSVAKFFHAIHVAETARLRLYLKDLSTYCSHARTLDYYVCPTCGFAALGKPPDLCPVCNTQGTKFEEIS